MTPTCGPRLVKLQTPICPPISPAASCCESADMAKLSTLPPSTTISGSACNAGQLQRLIICRFGPMETSHRPSEEKVKKGNVSGSDGNGRGLSGMDRSY